MRPCNIFVRFLHFDIHILPYCTSVQSHTKHKAVPAKMIFDTTETPAINLFPRRCRNNIGWRDCTEQICFPLLPISETNQMLFHDLVLYLTHSNAFCQCDTKRKNAYPQASLSVPHTLVRRGI